MKRVSVVLCLVCALALSMFMFGCSSEPYVPQKKDAVVSGDALNTDGVLRVGVDTSNPPYAAEAQGSIVGINVDVAAALADQLGLKLELVDVGAKTDQAFTQDNVDVVMGVQNQNDAYALTKPYLESAIVLFATESSTPEPQEGQDFKIAAQSSSMSAWEVTDHYGQERLSAEADLKSAFEALRDGSVKYVAADAMIGAYVSHTLGIQAYPIAMLQTPTQYCMAVKADNADLQTAVANALDVLENGGIIGVIESKWLGEPLDLSKLPTVATATVQQPAEGEGDASAEGDASTGDEGTGEEGSADEGFSYSTTEDDAGGVDEGAADVIDEGYADDVE